MNPTGARCAAALAQQGCYPEMMPRTVETRPPRSERRGSAFEFKADNPGRWFFHCHNAYHMEVGMAREVRYVP